MEQPAQASWIITNKVAVAVCAAMLVAFYFISYAAVLTKCATMDEPLHTVGAVLRVFYHDYRIDAEDPPLWNYWAMLPHSRGELHIDFDDPAWQKMLIDPLFGASFVTRTLYDTHGNDGARFINESRAAMLLIGVMLGALLAGFAWKICGRVGAVVATFLYCFDPNFLAHAPLVKNDVAIALVMLALASAIWSVGRRVRWWNWALPGMLVGMGMSVKFSGVLFLPMLVIGLFVRALLPEPWPLSSSGGAVGARGTKLMLAFGMSISGLLIAWAVVWTSYGFRFEPTNQPGVLLPIQKEVRSTARNLLYLQNDHRYPTDEQIDKWQPTLLVRSILWAQEQRLLPQAWLDGFLTTYHGTLVRTTYLLGRHSETGWWYYFPLAMLFKTPIATLLAFFAAVAIALRARRIAPSAPRLDWWTLSCLLIPVIVYGVSAVTSNLNLGLRHVLPVYPFLYIFVAIAATRALTWQPRVARPALIALGLGLLIETLAAFPDYIAFFNAPSRPFRLELLSDSNLDWGQDLPALAKWQRQHRGEKLYLAYFGSVDPAFYGIQYINMPAGFWLGPSPVWPRPGETCVVAVSATRLQGNNMPQQLGDAYAALRSQAPRTILGGSIYLFDFPPKPR